MILDKKVLINIIGPMTAGKSTLADALKDEIERIYVVDFDIIKRQLAGYYWKRDRAVTEQITWDTLASAARAGLPIITLLPPLGSEEVYTPLKAIADQYGYRLINIEMTAPEKVLVERYKARLAKIEESGTKAIYKNMDEFLEMLHRPYYRDPSSVTFDSSKLSPEEILQRISAIVDGEA